MTRGARTAAGAAAALLAASLCLAAEPPATPAQVKISTEAETVSSVYTGDKHRDPFVKSSGVAAKPREAAEFSIHALALRALMKDAAADYALFIDEAAAASYVLRKGKLYDARNKAVPGVVGSMNISQKTVTLMTPEKDVQVFRLGEEEEDEKDKKKSAATL